MSQLRLQLARGVLARGFGILDASQPHPGNQATYPEDPGNRSSSPSHGASLCVACRPASQLPPLTEPESVGQHRGTSAAIGQRPGAVVPSEANGLQKQAA